MKIELREEPITALALHAQISIAFNVDRVFSVSPQKSDRGEFVLTERKLVVPYVKDYDALDGGPARWAERFDGSKWGLISAHSGDRRVGGAVIVFDTNGVDMLEGRSDLAVLWDIRVHPGFRGQGIGAALIRVAEKWAQQRGCRQLKVETQNINVAACRFYARQGFVLREIDPCAYKELPEETQLLWYKEIAD